MRNYNLASCNLDEIASSIINNSISVEDWFELLKAVRAIEDIEHSYIEMFESLVDISDNLKKLFYIYFAVVRSGSIRILVDPKRVREFVARWASLWADYIAAVLCDEDQQDLRLDNLKTVDFSKLITDGVQALQEHSADTLIKFIDADDFVDTDVLFVIKDQYLYSIKHYRAKRIIEAFFASRADDAYVMEDVEVCEEYKARIDQLIKPEVERRFVPTNEQLKAIKAGLDHRLLIVTGGPGTGKTTSVLYMLWFLLSQNTEMLHYDIHLAAPSGKAAERMYESLSSGLNCIIKSTNESVYRRLESLEGKTIHRLLNYNPEKGKYSFNEKVPFADQSIFIIDESSMIDIVLFSQLLVAIPRGARVILLGDANQLPSVDVGSVFKDIVDANRFVVRLRESKRFGRDSNIGKLANRVLNAKAKFKLSTLVASAEEAQITILSKIDLPSDELTTHSEHDSIFYRLVKRTAKTARDKDKKEMTELAKQWRSIFYSGLYEKALAIDPESLQNSCDSLCKELWSYAERARILCLQNDGVMGIRFVNQIIEEGFLDELRQIKLIEYTELAQNGGLFTEEEENTISRKDKKAAIETLVEKELRARHRVGQFLMVTRNQKDLGVYNGDCGFVVCGQRTKRLYLMLKKTNTHSRNSIIQDHNEFVFKPLSELKAEELKPAYAMTVHKSQGSEYDNIMVVLPSNSDHPLLTKQIIYTGVTRAKKTVTLVSTDEAFAAACCKNPVRDTGIVIN